MNYIGEESKTIHGETVYRYSKVVQSKKEAKEIKHRLSEQYECVVEMSKYENVGFDTHTLAKNIQRVVCCMYLVFFLREVKTV